MAGPADEIYSFDTDSEDELPLEEDEEVVVEDGELPPDDDELPLGDSEEEEEDEEEEDLEFPDLSEEDKKKKKKKRGPRVKLPQARKVILKNVDIDIQKALYNPAESVQINEMRERLFEKLNEIVPEIKNRYIMAQNIINKYVYNLKYSSSLDRLIEEYMERMVSK